MAQHRTLGATPIVLAIESATACASVALLAGERVVGERRSEAGRHHSETLLPMIDALLADVGVSLAEVDGFAVSIGPGAFTSLRIGVSTVKGLCFGMDTPVVSVPTLRALAWTARRSNRVASDVLLVPVLDARRGEVYAAAYRPDPDAKPDAESGDIEVLSAGVHDAAGMVAALPQGGCLVGDGGPVIFDEVDRRAPGRFELVADPTIAPDAASVGLLALPELIAGRGVDAASLVPRYVRRAEAEVARTRQRFE